MWAIIAVGGALAGLVTFPAADEVFSAQRTERHSVQAVLLTDTPSLAKGVGSRDLVEAKVRCTTADGARRTDSALVETGQKAGSKVVVWLDSAGNSTIEPPSSKEAGPASAVLGLTAAHALRRTGIRHRSSRTVLLGHGVGPGGAELGPQDQLTPGTRHSRTMPLRQRPSPPRLPCAGYKEE
ncbi:hypothetical protein ACGFY9_40375 [Streptomyces sp. NPDC048504]|uniref:hypothetical protein n=1 Tax=Streptomyces sp. NPDC048504 TaxID=3365559 RepID=UPI0037180168